MKDGEFLLDILCIFPTLISQILYRFYLSNETDETRLFDYLTCLKLFRLFRLTRHSKSLKSLLKILYINLKDILRLTILIIFGTFYFGLTQFVLEQLYEDNELHNIGEALWHVNIPSFILTDTFSSRDSPSSSRSVIPTLLNINSYRIHWRLSVFGMEQYPWRLFFQVSINRIISIRFLKLVD